MRVCMYACVCFECAGDQLGPTDRVLFMQHNLVILVLPKETQDLISTCSTLHDLPTQQTCMYVCMQSIL